MTRFFNLHFIFSANTLHEFFDSIGKNYQENHIYGICKKYHSASVSQPAGIQGLLQIRLQAENMNEIVSEGTMLDG